MTPEPHRTLHRARSGEKADGTVLQTMPSWFISLALHGAILLLATLFYVKHTVTEDDSVYITQIRRPDAPKIANLDPPPPKKNADDEAQPPDDPSMIQEPGAEEEPSASSAAEEGLQDSGGASPLGVAGLPGAGGGSGGGYRSRASRAGSSARGSQRSVTDKRLKAALCWLARHQNPDGSWSATQFAKQCGKHGYAEDCSRNEFSGNEQYDVGVTGLALLALLGAGYTPSSKEAVDEQENAPASSDLLGEGRRLSYGDVVKNACKHLISVQDSSGRIGPDVDRYIYNHLLGSLALAEAYGITRIWLLRRPVEKAVRFLQDSRSPQSGWRYGVRPPDTDTSVTGWAVAVLHSALSSGLMTADRSLYDDVRRWFDLVTVKQGIPRKSVNDPDWDEKREFLLTGYLSGKDAGRLVSVSGQNEHYSYTPALTAIMLLSRFFLDEKRPAEQAGIDTLLAFPPVRWSREDPTSWRRVDLYYWYHATLALAHGLPPEDGRWKKWTEALRPALFESQNLQGFDGTCLEGSWDPVDRWSCEGGRVYTTAIAALTLEACYRFSRVLGAPRKERPIHVDD